MEAQVKEDVIEAIDKWAGRQDNTATIGLGSLGSFTPRQIAEGVRTGSPAGELFLKMVENGLRRLTIGEILASFRGEPVPKRVGG
jgi:hypothetical protein